MKAVVIDDHPKSLKQVIGALRSFPWEMDVTGFEDGKQALQFMKQQPVSLAVMETNIGGTDGVELARQIRDLQPAIYIVFVTDNPSRALDAFKVRADGYLLKPADAPALRGAIMVGDIA